MRALALLLASLLAGCGTTIDTVSPHELGPRPYGGVRLDASMFSQAPELIPLVLVDLPLSAALDTLLLPLTIPVALLADDPPPPPAEEGPAPIQDEPPFQDEPR